MEQEKDVKLRILVAAKRLFAEQGYDRTTVRQICDAAKANVALVSYYFGGKENVYYAVFEHYYPKLKAIDLERYAHDPVCGVAYLVKQVLQNRIRDMELASIIKQEIMLGSPRAELLQQYVFPFLQPLRELLQLGREQGKFDFRSVDHTFSFILGVVVYPKSNSFTNELMTEGVRSDEELEEDAIAFVMRALTSTNQEWRVILESHSHE